MLLEIDNDPRAYGWGSRTAIAELRGRAPGGEPEAEVWFGAHPGCPSRILEPARTGGHEMLDAWIAADPERALGSDRDGDTLPFLMKILAAEQPLSIQVHPDREQAERGFAAENACGVGLDDPARTYRDDRPKPETALAIGGPFDALVGFRHPDRTLALLEVLAARIPAGSPHRTVLGEVASALTRAEPEEVLRSLVARFLEPAQTRRVTTALAEALSHGGGGGEFSAELRTLGELQVARPGDVGVLVALLMNRVRWEPGEAVHVEPGVIHSYLGGLAVEVMVASDNVVRAGLTDKHVDVRELTAIASFVPSAPGPVAPTERIPGVRIHRPTAPDVQILEITSGNPHGIRAAEAVELALPGAAIALAVDGAPQLTDGEDHCALGRGQAVFITGDARSVRIDGAGRLALVTTGPDVHVAPRVEAGGVLAGRSLLRDLDLGSGGA